MAKLVADFKDVESGGGGGARVPEGDYRVKVVEVKVGTSKSSGNTMLIWTFEITEGKYKGKKLNKDYTTLNKEALWKLKGLLEAMGITVPNKKLDLTPLIKKAKGAELGVTVTDDEYEKDGKTKVSSKISDYLDLDTLEADDEDEEDEDDDDTEDDDDDEEEEEKPKAKKKKSKKKSSDDDDEEIEDLDIDEL